MRSNGGSVGRSERDVLLQRTIERAGELAAARRRRRRLLTTVPAAVLVVALSVGALAAAVVATGGHRSHPEAATGPRTTTEPGSRAARSTSTTAPVPAPGVIIGFDPVSFTAVSLEHWWVLGEVPCHGSHCLAIAETRDGGATFSTIPAPAGATPDRDGRFVLRFAGPTDGYLVGSHLWSTTDDGAHWVRQHLSGSVTALEAADGKAFALSCGSAHCSLLEAAVGSSSWRTVALPRQLPNVAFLSVVGTRVVVTSSDGPSRIAPFQLSTDGGTSFSVLSTPCYSGLGGHVVAAAESPSALWASCPSGMMAAPFHSGDNGSVWSPAESRARSVEFSNALGIAAVSADTALVWPFESSGALALTTDGGARYTRVLDAGAGATVVWAGYSDSERAYALLATGLYAGQLWISSDGGRSWSRVRFTR
ncbi:MAG TPA: hypothetical protein VKU92_11580 [Acidimicrobiales bacterium]|nr:hypothetical protein [Acidimicrobiales bacterium]